MSRLASTVRRLAGNGTVQDVCAFIAAASFIITMTYGAAGLAMIVAARGLGQ